MNPPDDSPVIDLMPVLHARRRSKCDHSNVSLDSALAELECDECGAQLNPYWWIGRLCDRWATETRRVREHEENAVTEANRRIALLNHRITQLALDVETLEAKKRQLMQEQVGDLALGRQVKRWRRAPR